MRKVSAEEWMELSLALEKHHVIFYKMWQMGRPVLTEDVETAAVAFDEAGEYVQFLFNPKLWDSLDLNGRMFVICHEALHVILNHGVRTTHAGKMNRGATNAALDIVVNHMLVRNFGFDRQSIQDAEKWCWVDTVFPGKNLPENEMFEFYFNKFEKSYGHGGTCASTVDDHSFLDGKGFDKVIDELNGSMSGEEKSSLQDLVEKHFAHEDKKESRDNKAGAGTGGWTFVNTPVPKPKKKWETVIRTWAKKMTTSTDKDTEQWVRLNRRMAMLKTELFLPSEMEVDEWADDKKKIEVYFFMDTSGSCWGLKERFFTAAQSLDPKRFDVKMLCFDTKVVPTTLESRKIYGGGGTAFDILEKYIEEQGGEYPRAAFVITDGYGNTIKPRHPERWHWFLTEYSTRSCIDPDCNFHSLKDYE